MPKQTEQDPKINELLISLSDSRDEITKDINTVNSIKDKVIESFPDDDTSYRNRMVLDDKLKVTSSFFSTLLSLRQEYNRTIKDEIELRRKISSGSDEDMIDIRKFSAEIAKSVPKHLANDPELLEKILNESSSDVRD